MNFVVNGGPATGKGTRCEILAETLGIAHISTGEMLREVSKTNSEIAGKMARGELISDELVAELVKERLKEPDCNTGFVLDGYPRTLKQVKLLNDLLDELGIKLTKVIELVVPDNIVFERILGRRECASCGKGYGMNKSVVEGVCDDCGGKLVSRSDDTEETLKRRIDIYKENSKGILWFYENEGILVKLDSSNNPEKIVEVATSK